MAKQDKILWNFTNPDTSEQVEDEQRIESTSTGYGPAPQLAPAGALEKAKMVSTEESDANDDAWGGFAGMATPRSKFEIQTINIKRDFAWTYTDSDTARDDVPELILREERILQNPTINALAYNAFAGLDHLKDLTDNVSEGANGASQWIGNKATEVMNFMGVGQPTQTDVKAFGTAVTELVSEAMANDPLAGKHKDWNTNDYRQHLEPYQRLYSTHPTGFKYKFPYFDDTYKNITTSFDGSAGDQSQLPFQKIVAKGTSLVGSIVNTFNALKPGTYIEAPKYASFPTSSYSYTTSFPLLNTVSFEQTFKNWQLLFMLVYQNLPNRVNRSVILPPKVYECRIPGVWYSRYSHISNLQINMIGSRREMKIPTKDLGIPGGSGPGTMKCIIPDAWEVSLTISELIPESQNYMFESIMRDGLITIDQRDSSNVSKQGSAAMEAIGNTTTNIISNVGASPPKDSAQSSGIQKN